MTGLDRVAAWPQTLAKRARRLGTPQRTRSSLSRPPLPTFLIVGAQKGGTRWLRYNLGRHPEVFTAETELHYFNSPSYRSGLDWYREQFRGWNGERAIGESTPGYTLPRQRPARTAARIDDDLPEVRLFAVLRDPIERSYSAFLHHLSRRRIDPSTDLVDYVRSSVPEEERFQLVPGGWYAANLAPYLERFGDRLLVLLNDEASADPDGVYRRALEHVGVSPEFVPEGLDKLRFSNSAPRKSRYRSRGDRRRQLSPEERRALYPYFAEDIDRLEQMLGRDLSHWRPQA